MGERLQHGILLLSCKINMASAMNTAARHSLMEQILKCRLGSGTVCSLVLKYHPIAQEGVVKFARQCVGYYSWRHTAMQDFLWHNKAGMRLQHICMHVASAIHLVVCVGASLRHEQLREK